MSPFRLEQNAGLISVTGAMTRTDLAGPGRKKVPKVRAEIYSSRENKSLSLGPNEEMSSQIKTYIFKKKILSNENLERFETN